MDAVEGRMRLALTIGWLAGAALLGGCLVHSFHPFAEDSQLVAVDRFDGAWEAYRHFDQEIEAGKRPVFEFGGDELMVVEAEGWRARFACRWFEMDGRLHLDLFPKDGEGHEYFRFHVSPMHALYRVEGEGGELRLLPLDVDWLDGKARAEPAALPRMEREDGWHVYLLEPRQWQDFLARQASDDPAAFSRQNAIFLRSL